MKNIALIMPNSCYAPEIPALKSYIEKRTDIVADILSFEDFIDNQFKYNLVYIKMGFIPLWDNKIKIPQIHDYTSLSIGRFAKAKDLIKLFLSKKPILRSFLNQEVSQRFKFKDNIPYIHRDMGADDFFFNKQGEEIEKIYDYCYVGSITDNRKVDKILERFITSKSTICLVGKVELSNYDKYKNYKNIYFLGLKNRFDTAQIIKSSIIGFNFIPDIYPWNIQTSTKVIEYLSSNLTVVSNRYKWINNFSNSFEISEISFYEDIDNFDPDIFLCKNIILNKKNTNYDYFQWDNIFNNSKILSHIEQHFN